jgi:hypothetical protein
MNPYYLLYYRIYKATSRTNKDVVEWTTMIALSLLVFLNLMTLLELIWPHILKGTNKNISILGGLFVLATNYYIFIFKDKYLKIVKDYSNKKKLNSFFIGVITIIYIIGSIYFMLHVLRGLN